MENYNRSFLNESTSNLSDENIDFYVKKYIEKNKSKLLTSDNKKEENWKKLLERL